MKFRKYILNLFMFLLVPVIGFSQGPEMADLMRSNGKIYVVVGVILIIFSGILFYLFQTGKKVEKLEKELKEIEKES